MSSDPGRRAFLTRVSAAAVAVAAALTGVPFVGAFLSPVVRRQVETWRDVGAVDDFAIGETRKVDVVDPDPLPWAGFAARSAVWLRREEGSTFVALSMYCTHVGCPVHWRESAGLFLCPCHGGVFYRDGTVAAGPPTRPLPTIPVRVRGGRVEVRSAVTPVEAAQ